MEGLAGRRCGGQELCPSVSMVPASLRRERALGGSDLPMEAMHTWEAVTDRRNTLTHLFTLGLRKSPGN